MIKQRTQKKQFIEATWKIVEVVELLDLGPDAANAATEARIHQFRNKVKNIDRDYPGIRGPNAMFATLVAAALDAAPIHQRISQSLAGARARCDANATALKAGAAMERRIKSAAGGVDPIIDAFTESQASALINSGLLARASRTPARDAPQEGPDHDGPGGHGRAPARG